MSDVRDRSRATGCARRYDRSRVGALLLVAACAVRAEAEVPSPGMARLPSRQQKFLDDHCFRCHGPDKQEGAVRLDQLPLAIESVENAERWQRVLDVLNAGEMPPEGEPAPGDAAKAEFLDALSHAMVAARKTIGDQGQAAALRRLNRREYVNTIRDLLGVETDAAGLPDDVGNGAFDTFGSSLFMSSDQIRRYLENGRAAVAAALAEIQSSARGAERRTQRTEVEVFWRGVLAHLLRGNIEVFKKYSMWKASKGKSFKEFGFIDEADAKLANQFERDGHTLAMYLSLPDVDTVAYLTLARTNYPYSVRVEFPKDAVPGNYRLRVRAGLFKEPPPERRFMEMTVSSTDPGAGNASQVVDVFEVPPGTPRQKQGPEPIEIPIRLAPDGPRTLFFQEKRHANPSVDFFRFQASINATGFAPAPAIWVDWIEWEGPLPDPAATERAVQLLGSVEPPEDDDAVRAILTRFATRAFRGVPPKPDFIERLVAIHRAERAAGDSFLEALEEPLAVVLASPGFLYLHEPVPRPAVSAAGGKPEATDRRLTDMEIASRLAYFLWAAPPDDALIEAASSGRLRQPEVLEEQVKRMIASPKSFSFAKGFTHQWLAIDRLDFFKFDAVLYPDFDESTREAAKQEVYHTFHTLLRENLDARCLLKSDFVVVNAMLASYYGLTAGGQPIHGMHFRRVPLPPDSPRGGLLGMAAILGMGSNGERTSPVERGAWVLRKLLNDPPPPAPPNVPQLSRLDGKPLSTPERLRLHQEEPQCAQCHRRIDPIGFALENFDASGKWRTVDDDRKAVPYEIVIKHTWPLETAGAFRDGTPFKDYFELRDRIADRGDAFLRGLIENLFQYAVGRPTSFADADILAGLVTRAKESRGGLAAIVRDIVQTSEFQTK